MYKPAQLVGRHLRGGRLLPRTLLYENTFIDIETYFDDAPFIHNAAVGICAHLLSDGKITEATHLLKVYREKNTNRKSSRSRKLVFAGVGARDVYNPTKPFITKLNNQTVEVMAARVEARDSEVSEVMFFTPKNGVWSPLEGAPIFKMQDPFFTFINNELILGGVEIFHRPEGGYGYKTIFMRGNSLETLQPFAEGPSGCSSSHCSLRCRKKSSLLLSSFHNGYEDGYNFAI